MSFKSQELIGMVFTSVLVFCYQILNKTIKQIKTAYNDLDIACKVAKQCFKDVVL